MKYIRKFKTINENNLILSSDSYKYSQFEQLPEKTEFAQAYAESRGGVYSYTIPFGLAITLIKYFAKRITMADVKEAREVMQLHGVPFNYKGWKYVVKQLDGKLPVEIRMVAEGTKIATKNALILVENTKSGCAWLVTFIETILLRGLWYGTTVATLSHNCKAVISEYLEKNGTPEAIHFKLHDFGSRGVSSRESAGIGGAAHLVNFMGTDTIEALIYARNYYDAEMAGFSIPASEHSTITIWGRANEIDAFKNMINKFGAPGKIYACVSDSYNLDEALKMWKELEPLILEKGGTLVVRPDSGDPVLTPCNTVLKLMDLFGNTYNDKGYKVLPDHIRVIQGDGVHTGNIRAILDWLDTRMVSSDNMAFGMGGELLQKINRDTQKFAIKMCWAQIDGESVEVYKDPITDPGKASKRGYLGLFKDAEGNFYTLNADPKTRLPIDPPCDVVDAMVTVFKDGELMNLPTFDEIRERADFL